MTDIEDLKLKAEIDDIMKSVDNIMQQVETAIPAQQEETQSPSKEECSVSSDNTIRIKLD